MDYNGHLTTVTFETLDYMENFYGRVQTFEMRNVHLESQSAKTKTSLQKNLVAGQGQTHFTVANINHVACIDAKQYGKLKEFTALKVNWCAAKQFHG